MPRYDFVCPKDSRKIEAFIKLSECDSAIVRCPLCEHRMVRARVYAFSTPQAQAVNWPYLSDALIPSDPALHAKYLKERRIRGDGDGGYQVLVESPQDYKHLCKEQGKPPVGDYETVSKSRARPWAKARARRRQEQGLKARAHERKRLKEAGLL